MALTDAIRGVAKLAEGTLGNTLTNAGEGLISPQDEPQHAYRWEVTIDGPAGSDYAKVPYYAKQTAIPPLNITKIAKHHCGADYFYSGKDSSPHEISVTFWDNQDLEVWRFFYTWMKQQNDSLGYRKVSPQNYMRNMSIVLKDTTDVLVNGTIHLDGVFPIELGQAELSYDASSVMEFTVTFSYKHMELDDGPQGNFTQYFDIFGDFPGKSLLKTAANYARSWF